MLAAIYNKQEELSICITSTYRTIQPLYEYETGNGDSLKKFKNVSLLDETGIWAAQEVSVSPGDADMVSGRCGDSVHHLVHPRAALLWVYLSPSHCPRVRSLHTHLYLGKRTEMNRTA